MRVASAPLFLLWAAQPLFDTGLAGPTPEGGGPRSLRYEVEPAMAGDAGRARVTLTIRGLVGGDCTLLLPPGWFGGDSQGKSVRGLRATSPGARISDATRPGTKHLTCPPGGPVIIEYEVTRPPEPGGDGGHVRPMTYFYHFGEDLWIVPDWDPTATIPISLRWKGVPAGWTICHSYGSGDGPREFRDSIERFRHASFVGGDFRVLPIEVEGRTITLAMRGRPAITNEALAGFLRRLYGAQARFWRDNDFLYTLVVFFPTGGPAGNLGGEGRTNSLSVHVSEREPLGFGIKHLLSHELFHGWNPAKLRWDGQRSYWFTEGVTDYYAALILLRAGLCSLQEFIDFVNHNIESYYLSRRRNQSYRRLMEERDSDADADRLIYSRGLLQALNWDAELRRAGAGRASLDDVMRGLLRSAARDERFALSDEAVATLLRPHLGDRAAEDIRRYVAEGQTIRPREGALGRGVELREVDTPTFALGFDPGSLAKRRISGVDRTGAAHRAGLRDGQEIVSGGYLPGRAEQWVELRVRDGDGEQLVRYRPKGPSVAVPQYRLRDGITAGEMAACLAELGVPVNRPEAGPRGHE